MSYRGGMVNMDEKTFFSLLFILLAIGTIASAITGVVMPGGSSAVVTAANNSIVVASPSITVSAPLTGGDQRNATYYSIWNWGFLCNYASCPFYVTLSPPSDNTWTGLWGLSGIISQISSTIVAFISWIWGGLVFIAAVFSYFTGIGAFASGKIAMPGDLNLIFILGITFLWLFLILELARRIIGVVWGR